MLDHVAIQCTDLARSAAFYDAVLQPLGGRRMMDFDEAIGYDPDGNNVEAVCHSPEQ
jgi:catechol 2,3-dioxygenase-like lactoylglutathione lyase family enzyme